jgi:hypothetical protein
VYNKVQDDVEVGDGVHQCVYAMLQYKPTIDNSCHQNLKAIKSTKLYHQNCKY